jgi:hypothetical protein
VLTLLVVVVAVGGYGPAAPRSANDDGLGVRGPAQAFAAQPLVVEPLAAEPRLDAVSGSWAFPTAQQLREARRYAEARRGVVAYSLMDDEGREAGLKRTTRFKSASVVKAMLLVALLDRRREQPLSAADRRLLEPMIRVSDNGAATAVHRQVGAAGLRRVARRARMRDFVSTPAWGGSLITAADQSRLFLRLDSLLPERHRVYARAQLGSIVRWQSWGIPEIARPRYRVLFKGGWRSTPRGRLVSQASRLERDGRVVGLTILTDGSRSHAEGKATLRGVARRLLGPN